MKLNEIKYDRYKINIQQNYSASKTKKYNNILIYLLLINNFNNSLYNHLIKKLT
jgi:hypothetical protein